MSQAFDKYEKLGAYHWDWYDNPDYAWYKECVDRCVDFCKGSTIDLGGGDGLVSSKILTNGHQTIVVDCDTKAIKLSQKAGLSTLTVDINNWAFNLMPTYEYLVCINTIEHLKKPEKVLEIVGYVTKGAIIITDMPTKNKGRYHEHEYTKQELLDTFKEFKPKYFVINSTEFGKPIQFHGVEIKK